MKYQQTQEISREVAIKTFLTGSNSEICDALLAVAFYDNDWRWSQAQCLHFLNHDASNVRAIASTCLGHIARIHKNLDRELVVDTLKNHLKDQSISGTVEDALDDIHVFLGDDKG